MRENACKLALLDQSPPDLKVFARKLEMIDLHTHGVSERALESC